MLLVCLHLGFELLVLVWVFCVVVIDYGLWCFFGAWGLAVGWV